MTPAIAMLRLCFIVLFGTMSLLHGPVMTFSSAHTTTPTGIQTTGHSVHDLHHVTPDCHEDQAPPAKHAECNAFACFMAVEPPPAMAQLLSPILFAIMDATSMTALDPVQTTPALPPPRLQG